MRADELPADGLPADEPRLEAEAPADEPRLEAEAPADEPPTDGPPTDGPPTDGPPAGEPPTDGSPADEPCTEAEAAEGRFVAVAVLADVPPGGVAAAEVDGRSIALVNDGGVIHALDGDCSHAGGPLAEGRTAGCLLACPWHGAVFDARTGEPARGPARKPVATHPVRVDGETVLVAVAGSRDAGDAGDAG